MNKNLILPYSSLETLEDCSLYWWDHVDSKMTEARRDFYNDGTDGSSAGRCKCETNHKNNECYANSPYCMNKEGNIGWIRCNKKVDGMFLIYNTGAESLG